jgi:DNA-binding CsgD family transcriptional regulator
MSSLSLSSIANMIDHVRETDFPNALIESLASVCQFDTALIVTYKKAFKPIMLYPVERSEISPTLINYINQYYVLDPLFNAIQSKDVPFVSRMSDLAPDSFETTEYFLSCYKNFGLIDEINLVIQLTQSVTCSITLGRLSQSGPVEQSVLDTLNDIYPVIDALVKQFWLQRACDYVQFEQPDTAMNAALDSFGADCLTKREREITRMILKGHSSKSIAKQLHISLGTVKVHRKNIHTKLDTSSNSDIFTLFLEHLNQVDEPLGV